MGAIAVTSIKRRYFPDGGKLIIADITGSSSYATNGDTYTTTQLDSITGVIDAIIDCGTPGYVLVPDIANKKIKYYKGAAGLLVEETAATNLSAVTSRVMILCDNVNV